MSRATFLDDMTGLFAIFDAHFSYHFPQDSMPAMTSNGAACAELIRRRGMHICNICRDIETPLHFSTSAIDTHFDIYAIDI